VNTWINGKVEAEGQLTVPARIINEYISNLPTDKVVLESEKTTLNIESDNYHTSLKGLPAEDFPLIPHVDDLPFARIDAAELRNVFSETIWASAANETQPEISGIFMAFSTEGGETPSLRVAATDRYRLAERCSPLVAPINSTKEVIVPSRTISELYKILSTGQGEVEIYFSDSQVLFKFNDTELISRLIDGQYPDYKQIIPKEYKTEAKVLREEFMHAVKATALFAPDSNNVSVEIAGSSLTVKASSAAAGENTAEVKAAVTGSDNSAIFNYRYLLDCLNNLSEPEVSFKMINDASPASIVPVGRDNYVYIVMPIKL
jgi:DNA polymerase-3 subunit beta